MSVSEKGTGAGRESVIHAERGYGCCCEEQYRQQHGVFGCAVAVLFHAVNEDQRAVDHGQLVGL